MHLLCGSMGPWSWRGFLSPFHCRLRFLKSFHLPENLNIYGSPLSIYALLCSFCFPLLFVLLFLLGHSWCFTHSTHSCTQALWQGLCQVPGTQRQSSYPVGRTGLNIFLRLENVPVTFIRTISLNLLHTYSQDVFRDNLPTHPPTVLTNKEWRFRERKLWLQGPTTS